MIREERRHTMMGTGSGMSGMWPFWLFGLTLVVGLVLLVVVVVRVLGGGIDGASRGASNGATRGRAVPPVQSRARQVLDERYARGELSTEEYFERAKNLGESL